MAVATYGFVVAEFATFLSRLEAQERVRGAEFERACKWLLENAPEYAARLERVWLWADWPGRGGRIDAGIDLVAQERGGGLWAVQAKHYDPRYAIKKTDVDSFLSESSRREFTYRLLIATTDHLGATARRTLQGQEKPVGMLLRSDLEMLDVPWPDKPGDLRPARIKPKRPRPHQRRAVRDIIAGFESGDRGQVVMACGTGKTLVARVLHDRMGSRRTLVVVPSLSLLKQSLREWLAAGTFNYLAVCSDETVTPDDADAVVSSTGELGVPVTTDPAQIGAFLRARGGGVVFATYQSSPQIAAAYADGAPAFDLVVADEAHRCAGPQAGVFATVLDAAKIKARKRVFMTATPRYFTGRVKKAALDADWEVASMDDEAKFGPVLHRLAFAEAIDRDLLCDYQVLVVGVSDRSYQQMAERGAFVTTDGETISDARTLARQIGTLRAMRNHDLHRIVSFHSRIDNATRFATSVLDVAAWMPDTLRPTGQLWAEHVSGRMSSGERETRLNRLRAVGDGERGVLTNARCLSEGVDVPTLDAVAFIDPRRSQVDVVQAVGRAIRKADDKTIGTIIIPVFVDEHADPEAALAASEFDRVWQIVRALRDHDDVLADELDHARRELGRRGTVGERSAKIVLDLPDTVGVDFARAFDTRLVEATTTSWEHWFGLLERFVVREGDARVPWSHVEDGYRLGQWVGHQRRGYRQGRLSGERVVRLEAVPAWAWDQLDADWDEGFAYLERFAAREGDTRVPARFVEDGYRLGQWVGVQRRRHGQGRLSGERVVRLEAVPGWDWDPLDTDWDEGFAHLERFATREGHARVPGSHIEDGYRLGQWVTVQRVRHGAGQLSSERSTRLEALSGWAWDPMDTAWDEGFAHLERFATREGHARVPGGHIEDGYRLGQWVGVQRRGYRKGRLFGERVVRLEALPGWDWDPMDADWENGFSHLEGFVVREGDARVPARYVQDGYQLGRWVNGQRMTYRKGQLSGERIERLQALPGWAWDPMDTAWDEGFAHLERFVVREGDARVPARYVQDSYQLGRWATVQRTTYRRGQLSGERIERLQALSGWAWDPMDTAWDEGFAHLERFATREGHARVPGSHIEDGYRLGQWVGVQRRGYRQGRLSGERVVRLEVLPGWAWDPIETEWENGFSQLERFATREGHARVPARYVEDAYRLGQWVTKQRMTYRKGQLSGERIERLQALPGWAWDPMDTAWDEGFAHLERFAAREGDARVPARYVEDGYRLGQWVTVQRRHSADQLPSERSTRLEAVPGWDWDPLDTDWDEGFAHLERFATREGHARVPGSHIEDGYRLGQWVSAQRRRHGQGRLSGERVVRLEAVPGWAWDPLDADWDEGFAHLERFATREGHARVAGSHIEDGYRLGQWVGVQRRGYRKGRLSGERVVRLEALPGWNWGRTKSG